MSDDQTITECAGPDRASDDGRSLQRAVAPMQLGCAVDGQLPECMDASERALLLRHFDTLTPENCMKPAVIQPESGRFEFAEPDALVRFADKHSLNVVGHCLVWHQQCPDWLFRNGEGTASREQVLERMRRHIYTVVGRYRGRVCGWDVVNEAVADRDGFLRKTAWLACVGEDFVDYAFRFARHADPSAELYYNDYNIELPEKRERTIELLSRLRSHGIRVDGVGIQGHWILDQVPFEEIERAIVAYHALGLKVMITELDLDVIDRPDCGADVSEHYSYSVEEDLYRNACPPEVLGRQAEQYGELFALFRRHRDKVARISFWGLHDGSSWLNTWPGERTNHPLLFDRRCLGKPAFERVMEVIT